jgi:hypothetical protein
MKSRATKREWGEARDKVEEEGRCRACLAPDGEVDDGGIERAHRRLTGERGV